MHDMEIGQHNLPMGLSMPIRITLPLLLFSRTKLRSFGTFKLLQLLLLLLLLTFVVDEAVLLEDVIPLSRV